MNKLVLAYAKSLFQSVNLKYAEAKDLAKKNSSYLKLKEPNESKISSITSMDVQDGPVTPNVIYEEFLLLDGFFLIVDHNQQIFKNPMYSEKIKLNMLFELFPGFSPPMQAFLKLLAERNHLYFLPQIIQEYEKLLFKSENIMEIKIIVASSFPATFKKTFFQIFQKLTKAKEVIFSIVYDPKILGGIILEYNSMIIDGSFFRELSTLFLE